MFLLFVLSLLATTWAHGLRDQVGEWHLTTQNPSPTHKQLIKISLKQRNVDQLESKLWSISDPLSPEYGIKATSITDQQGQYLSHEEIAVMIAPPEKVLRLVEEWLHQHGAEKIEINRHRDMLQATFPLHRLEAAFGAKFAVYKHSSGRTKVRATSHTEIPAKIAEFVDLIQGINDFPPLMKKKLPDPKPTTKAATPFAPWFVSVGSRGDATAITLKWKPTGADGKPITDPSYSSSLFWSYSYMNKKEGGMFSVDNKNCKPSDDKTILCVYTLVNKDFPFRFIQDFTLTAFKDSQAYSTTYPFPIVATPPIIPQKLWEFYEVPRNPTVSFPTFAQCVVEFEQQYYSPSDLQKFFQEMGLPSNASVIEVGPNDPTNPGGEANLDIQWLMAMAPGVPTWFWSIKAESSEEVDDILSWAYAIGNTTNPPLVNSISYGMTAANVDKFLGKGYLLRSDVEFAKLAAMGLTVIIADGDNGAGDLGDPPMLLPSCKTRLNPDWPSQSPYITAVGSTYITPLAEAICYQNPGVDCTKYMPEGEVAVSLDNGLFWSTGGGFADYPARPFYQDVCTPFVLAQLARTTQGRAYPDVSAVGHNLLTVIAGENIPVDGTSASAPIFAGIVSLLTDLRLKAGQPALGFLNPLLYQISKDHPEAFYDVTIGANRCSVFDSDVSSSCCPYGYSAEVGWDPVTGLGTPNYRVLSQAVLTYKK